MFEISHNKEKKKATTINIILFDMNSLNAIYLQEMLQILFY